METPQNEAKCYVYRHIRLDKNEPFYIGIGTRNEKKYCPSILYGRAFQKDRNNPIWQKIIKKTSYEVEILLDDLTKEEAKEKEIEFIALYGRINLKTGSLANLTNGGEGIWGLVLSEHSRKKMSESAKRRLMSQESRAELSRRRMGLVAGADNHMSKQVIDIKTGEKYASISQAAVKNNIPVPTLKSYLSGANENITSLRKIENGVIVNIPYKGRPKIVRVVDISNGKKYRYVSDAAKAIGITKGALSSYLVGRINNPTSMRRVIDNVVINTVCSKTARHKKVIHISTGRTFKSIMEAERFSGIVNLKYHIKNNNCDYKIV